MVPTAFVDARSGATGDMWLGAVVGAGASLEKIEQAVSTLGIGDVRVSYGRVRRGGHDAVSVRVRAPEKTPKVQTISQVRALLRFAALDEAVRDRALAVFDLLAAAVAAAQAVTEDEVLFNEVGMLDDLAVIVGTCVGLDHLEVEELVAGPIGIAEEPEDAEPTRTVLHLLAGHETRPITAADGIVTRSGAALLSALTTSVAEPPELEVLAVGIGAASRELRGAGLLRLTVGRPLPST